MPHRSNLSILEEVMQRTHITILAPDHKCSSIKHLHDKTAIRLFVLRSAVPLLHVCFKN